MVEPDKVLFKAIRVSIRILPGPRTRRVRNGRPAIYCALLFTSPTRTKLAFDPGSEMAKKCREDRETANNDSSGELCVTVIILSLSKLRNLRRNTYAQNASGIRSHVRSTAPTMSKLATVRIILVMQALKSRSEQGFKHFF